MTVSIVIVTWNASRVIEACLRSVANQRGVEIRDVVIVDNASTDDTVRRIDALAASLPLDTRVIANPENQGYGAANNQGASVALGDFLVLLNPDTQFVGADSLARLCSRLRDARVGLAGPRLINLDGSLQPSCAAIPSVCQALMLGTGLHRLAPPRLKPSLSPRRWAHDDTRQVGWVAGACIAMRRQVFREVGGFSEATFMYGEDLELAYCTRQLGYRVMFTSEAVVMHHDDYSADQRWTAEQRSARVARGNRVFLERHYGPIRGSAIRLTLASAYLGRWALFAVVGDERAAVCRAMVLQYVRVRDGLA